MKNENIQVWLFLLQSSRCFSNEHPCLRMTGLYDDFLPLSRLFHLFYFIYRAPISFSLFFLFIFISWRLITLQYCSDFCHTFTWISHEFTVSPILNSPSTSLSTPSLWVILVNTRPEHLSHASNLGWRSVSHLIIYMFQCYSLRSSHPRLLPQSPKVCSIHLCLFFCPAYRVIVTVCLNSIYIHSVQFSSVAQSCPTPCCPMNRSMPGLPVHHKLPEFIQIHAHQVGDVIKPSHSLLPPSPPAPNPSQHQGLFQWVNSSHQVAKVLEFQLQHQSFQWTPRTDVLYDGLVGSPCSPRDSQESSLTP